MTLTQPGHHLQSMLDPQKAEGETVGALSVAGKTLVLRNIGILASLYDLERIRIPENYPHLILLVQEIFPSITLEVCCNVSCSQTIREAKRHNGAVGYFINHSDRASPYEEQSANLPASVPDANTDTERSLVLSTEIGNDVSIQLPLNSALWFSKTGKERLYADLIIYPWDFLNISQKIIHEEVKESKISPTASIAKSSIIEGPCIISFYVIVDDFCKIKGPTYIGKGSYIGMGSLIRNNCAIGASVIISPGRHVSPNSEIQAGTLLGKC